MLFSLLLLLAATRPIDACRLEVGFYSDHLTVRNIGPGIVRGARLLSRDGVLLWAIPDLRTTEEATGPMPAWAGIVIILGAGDRPPFIEPPDLVLHRGTCIWP